MESLPSENTATDLNRPANTIMRKNPDLKATFNFVHIYLYMKKKKKMKQISPE